MKKKFLYLLLAASMITANLGSVAMAADGETTSQIAAEAENENAADNNASESTVPDENVAQDAKENIESTGNDVEEDNAAVSEEDGEEKASSEENAASDLETPDIDSAENTVAEQEDESVSEDASINEEPDVQETESPMVENSWRYTDGVWTPSEIMTFSDDPNAWGKVDGYFVNNLGDKIEGAVARGIDVSHHQGEIDWEKVKDSDIDFVIIRCGYGGNDSSQDDKYWERNVSECERLGIPYGVYIYSYAMNVESAKSEADHVLRLLKGHNPDYPVYYDLENEGTGYDQSKLGAKTLGDMAEAFCNKITAAGYDVGIYANKNWFTNILTDSRFAQWDKWVAQYNPKCTYEGEYVMWQATASGRIDGIDGPVDINFEFENWQVNTIKTDIASPQTAGKNITLSADMSGATSGLEYKFVWMKDNWQSWDVIQAFSKKSTAVWTPKEDGDYTLYMDVQNQWGKIVTVTIPYKIQSWHHGGVTTNIAAPQVKNQGITVKGNVEGNSDGLEYKFVWMKNNWQSWNVIQDFSKKNTAVWTPKESGKYTLYVDIRDKNGVIETKTVDFEILDRNWKLSDIQLSTTGNAEVGKGIQIIPQITQVSQNAGNADLEFKYVWMKNGWNAWGVIQDFSDSKSVTWIPTETGDYYFYVDAQDQNGYKETVYVHMKVSAQSWSYNSVKANVSSPQVKETRITVTPQLSGNLYGLQYKFVWEKDNWNKWGVFQQFSNKNSAVWQPDEPGNYTIYVDVRDIAGNIITKTMDFEVWDKEWKIESINFSPESSQTYGESFVITPVVKWIDESKQSALEYKYVWMTDGWKKWDVIAQFSGKTSVEWMAAEPAEYGIYVDVRDSEGNMETMNADYTVAQGEWKYEDLVISQVGNDAQVKIAPQISGNTYGLEYKYVWMKDGWQKWGVIKSFSDQSSINWTTDPGEYEIYVDVMDKTGSIVTLHKEFTVN